MNDPAVEYFKETLASAVHSRDQDQIDVAFRRASLNNTIPYRIRADLIGQALNDLSVVNIDSARQAASKVGFSLAALQVQPS